MESAEEADRRSSLLRCWRTVHSLEFLVEGRARCADGDTDDGMVVGVLHAQRAACNLRRVPAVYLHQAGSPVD